MSGKNSYIHLSPITNETDTVSLKTAVETAEVFIEVPAVRESLLTVLTEVWPVIDVCAHVAAQLCAVRERLAAVGAEIWTFARVFCHVDPHLTRTVPDLPTDCTAERPVSRVMQLNVFSQFDNRRKHFSVFPTLESTLPCSQHVHIHASLTGMLSGEIGLAAFTIDSPYILFNTKGQQVLLIQEKGQQ